MGQTFLEERISEFDLMERGFRKSGDTWYNVLIGRIPGGEAVDVKRVYIKIANGIYTYESTSYVTKTMVEMS